MHGEPGVDYDEPTVALDDFIMAVKTVLVP